MSGIYERQGHNLYNIDGERFQISTMFLLWRLLFDPCTDIIARIVVEGTMHLPGGR